MKFSQFFIIPAFWHLKVKVVKPQSKKGHFLMNQRRIKFNFLIERKIGAILMSLTRVF